MQSEIGKVLNESTIKYFVVFDNGEEQVEKYDPLIYLDPDTVLEESIRGHLLDPALEEIIPALRYILHLPRNFFDTVEIDVEMAFQSEDVEHDILIIPSNMIEIISMISLTEFCFVVYQDSCKARLNHLNEDSCISVMSVSDLLSKQVLDIWEMIYSLFDTKRTSSLPNGISLFSDSDIVNLPLVFPLNHLGKLDKIYSSSVTKGNLLAFAFKQCRSLHCDLNYIYKLNGNPDMNQEELRKDIYFSTKVPIVISMMGRPVNQKKISKETVIISDVEREACRISLFHRSIAVRGFTLELEDIPGELFVLLNNLEKHCRLLIIDNKYVWSTLRRMGRIFEKHIGKEKAEYLTRAKSISAFTDFPVGLLILSDNTAPLCCYTPISYKPITPLTRTLQTELIKKKVHHIGSNCKIIIAECISEEDPIRELSKGSWNKYKEITNRGKNSPEIIIQDITSIKSLKNFVKSNSDADIMILSAHGAYDMEGNTAGLVIGDEIWYGNDNDILLPPLVMFSACHVNPRGSGSVNIADLMQRLGAIAVIGSFIPVNVSRNAVLFIRFLTYIQESLNGNRMYDTVSDLWTAVVANNAISEIISSNKNIAKWIMTRDTQGVSNLEKFMIDSSHGRLNVYTIYDDTIDVLSEMFETEQEKQFFDRALKSQSFFPESIFYQIVGSPENIYMPNVFD